MKLSFIIPVFKVGILLDKCLNSIYNNPLEVNQFEVIVVMDNSAEYPIELEIISKYKLRYNNFIVFFNKNDRGPGAPRNIGLLNAKGDYVWFIDSDDTINFELVPRLLKKLEEDNLDALCFGFNMVDEETFNKSECLLDDVDGDKILSGREFLLNIPMPIMPWCTIYRRHFLLNNDLTFVEGVFHEDQEFSTRAYFLSHRIAYSALPVYNYLQRKGSIMKSVNPKKTGDMIIVSGKLWDFALSNTLENTRERFFFLNKISFLYSQALRNMAICGFKEYKNLKFLPLSINNYLSLKEKLQYRLINFNIRLYVLIKKIALFLSHDK